MIEIKPLNSPGYPSTNLAHYGTVTHYRNGGFAVGVNWDYPSTLPIRRYLGGIEPPNYPVPAIPIKVTWGGVFWRWLTIVQCLAPHYRVVRYWEENP